LRFKFRISSSSFAYAACGPPSPCKKNRQS
jgi:hypothetical protein